MYGKASTPRWLIGITGLVLVASACGVDSAGDGSTTSRPAAVTTRAPTTTAPAAATTGVSTTTRAFVDVGDPQRGHEIWDSGGDVIFPNGCSMCHSLDGTEDDRSPSPSWLGISEVAGSRVPGLSATEYLRESIVDPGAYIVEGYRDTMPKSFALLLSEEDIAGLVAFLLTQ